MATDKLFSVAGISNLNGTYKVRFANDMMRIKVLAKSDHTDIRLVDLEKSVSKLEAAKMLLTHADFADAVAQSTITEYIEDNSPLLKSIEKAVKATAPKAVKAPAKVAVTEDENTSF